MIGVTKKEWDDKVDRKKKMNNICHFPLIFILINPNGKVVHIEKCKLINISKSIILRFD